MKDTKSIIIVTASLALVIALFVVQISSNSEHGKNNSVLTENKVIKFNSFDELASFIKSNQEASQGGYRLYESFGAVSKSLVTTASADSAGSYSKTNIQVKGVDEPDIVKNDGKYIYAVSGQKVFVIDAYPAESMKIVSELNISGVRDIFINGNKLIVFSMSYEYVETSIAKEVKCLVIGCEGRGNFEYKTFVSVYNLDVKNNPILEKNITVDGNYADSRMIGDYVYVVSSKSIYRDFVILPAYSINGVEKSVQATDVYYFGYPDNSYTFTSVSAINVKGDDFQTKVYLLGSTGTIFVSQDNIYISYIKTVSQKNYNERLANEVYLPLLPEKEKIEITEILNSSSSEWEETRDIQQTVYDYSNSLTGDEKADFDKALMDKLQEFNKKIQKENEKTVIHKINVDKNKIDYKSVGEVPGHVLNQFSMDEFNGNFRIATTTGEVWNGNSLNHIYVLDEDLKIIGKVEDLAHGERIYSARFIGERGYLVTFKKVDPLFVIDLKDSENPKVLGYLKIPGYSDYLHPYDENHIIGIGKDAIDASETEVPGRNLDFAWYQGVKIALFDITDVEHPVEKAKLVIGDRGTDSEALYEHKAFLFDKEKGVIVMPITLAEIKNKSADMPANTYGQTVWEGAYVLNIDLNNISVRGMITHNDNLSENSYGYSWTNKIQRSLYMDDTIYTISNAKIKANNLNTTEEINKVQLSNYLDAPLYARN